MTAQKWGAQQLAHVDCQVGSSRPRGQCAHARAAVAPTRLLAARQCQEDRSIIHPDREQQFDYIAVQRAVFTAAGLPILSVDTKKKELVGNFKNVGQAWALEPTAVNVHDYPHDALGRAVPYGVYDVTRNRGFVCVGASGDTPAFAVDTISAWWQTEGNVGFPAADRLLLLADAGGSNGCQIRAWKERLQVQICDRFGLTVTVCHYPTGCSRWNPIEHRLFSQISCNWAGVPLRTWDTVLAFIRGTQTATGLVVQAIFNSGEYPTGQKVSDAEMAALHIEHHPTCPIWNYTIRPRTSLSTST
jgi:Rhodopirellula transposase DDE domain